MSAADIVLLIGAISGLLVVFGGGLKYLLDRVDARARETRLLAEAANALTNGDMAKARLAELESRMQLSNRLHDDLSVMRAEIETLKHRNALYLQRIYQLEAFIHKQPGIDIPLMKGWPPND